MSVGTVVPKVTLLVELLKVWLLLSCSTEPPWAALDFMLAKVSVALAAPALFSVMVLPPQVEVSSPNCRAEADVPFATKVKLPFARFMVRAVPPIRVVAVPVSSTFSNALFWTVMSPVVALKAPDPLILKVPWLTANLRPVVWAVVQLSVPAPTLVMVNPEVPMLPLTLMIPVPTALKLGLLLRVRLPIFKVAPSAAPKVTVTEAVLVMAPLTELTPLAEKRPPVLLMPVGAPALVAAMLMLLVRVMPPESHKAAPAAAAPGFRMT